jgi:hypothetical protein
MFAGPLILKVFIIVGYEGISIEYMDTKQATEAEKLLLFGFAVILLNAR